MSEHQYPAFDIDKLLNQGLRRALRRIRFGGIAGKVSLIAIVAVVALGLVGLRSSEHDVHLLCLVLIAVIVLAVCGGILGFAFKYPEQAMMEGTEILAWQHMQLAAKGMPTPPEGSPRPIEGSIGPKLLDSGKARSSQTSSQSEERRP